MTRLLLFSCVLIAACTKPTPVAPATAGNKVDETAAAPPRPASGAIAISSAAEYEAKSLEMLENVLALFVADGTDCDKLAADVAKFSEDNRALIDGLDAFDNAHPDVEKAFDEKMSLREKEIAEKLGPAANACMDHQGLAAALQSIQRD